LQLVVVLVLSVQEILEDLVVDQEDTLEEGEAAQEARVEMLLVQA
jgi:hypothetical protein